MSDSSTGASEGSHVRRKDIRRIYGDMPAFMGFPFEPRVEEVDADAVILGMPFDGIATFRGGPNRLGPQEIRKLSLLYGDYNIEWDLSLSDHLKIVDVGDVDVSPADPHESFRRLERWIAAIVRGNAVPIMLGGDHAVSYPAFKAVAETASEKPGFLTFDTHLDFQDKLDGDPFTRASPTIRICELEGVDPRRVVIIGARGGRNAAEWLPRARAMGVTVFTMADIDARGINAVVDEGCRIATASGTGSVYVSVDIDGIDPAYAPATNSPEPGGLTSREIIAGMRRVARERLAGLDVVEVSPQFDVASGITSILAARLVEEALCGMAARRRDAGSR